MKLAILRKSSLLLTFSVVFSVFTENFALNNYRTKWLFKCETLKVSFSYGREPSSNLSILCDGMTVPLCAEFLII